MTDATVDAHLDATVQPDNPRDGGPARVAVVFGGVSPEHSISCLTAANVVAAMDPDRFRAVGIGITRDGIWTRWSAEEILDLRSQGQLPEVPAGHHGTGLRRLDGGTFLVDNDGGGAPEPVDVVFPLLHGPFGEDGTIQGLFEMTGVRYVGCGVAASAISMDKHLTKTVLQAAGIEVGRWELITPRQWDVDPQGCRERVAALGFPVFVKPCRAGSSIGISRVDSVEELSVAIKEARNNDPRVIVEAAVTGREIECGVLQGRGDRPPRTAPLGEIVLSEGAFYDYDSKYIDTEAVGLVCPADVPEADAARLHEAAARTFEALECEGLARVDFFYVPDTHEVIVNEVNTMPGFTPYSMFPLMWAQAGIEYADLVDELLEGALERDLGLR